MDGCSSRKRTNEVAHLRPSVFSGERFEVTKPTKAQDDAYLRSMGLERPETKVMCKFKAGRLNGMVVDHFGINIFAYGYLEPL